MLRSLVCDERHASPGGVLLEESHEELLNLYDDAGAVVGARPRREAKASGLAVGAVNILLANAASEVLLQRRPVDKENGGRWDKSVGGHVGAGESFDQTAVREAGEELFDDPASLRVRLAALNGKLRQGVLFAAIAYTSISCGGGGGSAGSPPATQPTFAISGTIAPASAGAGSAVTLSLIHI